MLFWRSPYVWRLLEEQQNEPHAATQTVAYDLPESSEEDHPLIYQTKPGDDNDYQRT